MQRAGIHCWCRQVALRHRSTRDRLSDSSLPAPLYISVLAGHGLCLSHTHCHCYSLLLRLPGRLFAPRAVFFSLILYLFAESGRAPMRSHMHHRFAPSCTMIQVPTDELNYGRDFLYNNKQHSVQRLHPRSPNNTFMSRLQRVQSSRGGTTTRSSSRTIIVRGYSSNDACRTVFFTVGTSLCINNDYKHT